MAIDPAAPRTRRAILGAALGGAGALFATALGRATPVAAANGDPVNLGQGTTSTDNAATLPTIVNSSVDALGGVSSASIGVYGISIGPGTPFPAVSHSTGVFGQAGDGTDITDNTNEIGVYGFSSESLESAGVWGDSLSGTGVVGTGEWGVFGTGGIGVVGFNGPASVGIYGFTGDEDIHAPVGQAAVLGTAGLSASTGVRGHAAAGANYGVLASAASTSQFALYVAGKLKLSRSGRTAFASTATSKKITMSGVTTSSWVIATLQTSVSGCYVRAVVPGTGYFWIYLSKAPGKTAVVGYVVVN